MMFFCFFCEGEWVITPYWGDDDDDKNLGKSFAWTKNE